jgi:hypothetical protein
MLIIVLNSAFIAGDETFSWVDAMGLRSFFPSAILSPFQIEQSTEFLARRTIVRMKLSEGDPDTAQGPLVLLNPPLEDGR